ncbi:MAG TPA: AAA family ATPase, partial [Cytophagales bacterium]
FDYSQVEKAEDLLYKIYASLNEDFEVFNPLYIPAERTILSMIAESLFGLLNNDISLAKCIKDFGSKFETARKELKKASIGILNAKYSYTNKTNVITLDDGTKLKLEQASSGFQSLTPLYLVVEHFLDKNSVTRNCVTVEEPELNLYPTNQKKLVEFLVRKTKAAGDKLIITTHSPYVVTTIDNLVQANNVAAARPEAKEELAGLVSPDLWLDYNKTTCYFFDNGSCRSTLDAETQSIGPSNLDDVSTQIGEVYERMVELKYS